MPEHDQPLADHPQLRILRTRLSDRPGDEIVEYRVYNYRVGRNGCVARGDTSTWADLLWVICLWTYYRYYEVDPAQARILLRDQWTCEASFAVWLLGLVIFMYTKTRATLYQSVLAIPDLGVQLETTRGISFRLPGLSSVPQSHLALSTSSTFIPLEQVSTVVLNEGLRRWRVEYYLAIIQRQGRGITVAFDQVRPPVAVLKEVLHGLRETLYDEYEPSDEDGKSGDLNANGDAR